MDQRMYNLGEMLQAAMIDEPLETVVDILAQTAQATADAEPDPVKRHRLRWYAKQLLKLRAGPTDAPRAPRAVGADAIDLALQRLMLRVNRMRDLDLAPQDILWLETLGDGLTHLVARLPERGDDAK